MFERKQQPYLPPDIVELMARAGRFAFYSWQASPEDAAPLGQMEFKLFQLAEADRDRFLNALADAVLPVGGWAVYGASKTVVSLLGTDVDHPSYHAIRAAGLNFLRANHVPPNRLSPNEEAYWKETGGQQEPWLVERPVPGPDYAPITPLKPNETRRVAQVFPEDDSNLILVRQTDDGAYVALVEGRNEGDPHRVQWEWRRAKTLYDIYREIGRAQQVPTYWFDEELEPFFPYPKANI